MYLIHQMYYHYNLVTTLENKDTDYSARITGALSLIKETKIFFKELNDDKELDEPQVSHPKIETISKQPCAFQKIANFWS